LGDVGVNADTHRTHSSDEDEGGGRVLFLPEPGSCGGRLDPHQILVPRDVAELVDWHVRPPRWGGVARTACGHIDYELISVNHDELFSRREQVGSPALDALWEARRVLAEVGLILQLEIQFEQVEGELAAAVYGAGVEGRLTDALWGELSALLTTCCSMVREPRPDIDLLAGWLAPRRPATTRGRRQIPAAVRPAVYELDDVTHTWWSYEVFGTLRDGCWCTAHTPAAQAVQIGPGSRVG
jgi:hypothetical protein